MDRSLDAFGTALGPLLVLLCPPSLMMQVPLEPTMCRLPPRHAGMGVASSSDSVAPTVSNGAGSSRSIAVSPFAAVLLERKSPRHPILSPPPFPMVQAPPVETEEDQSKDTTMVEGGHQALTVPSTKHDALSSIEKQMKTVDERIFSYKV